MRARTFRPLPPALSDPLYLTLHSPLLPTDESLQEWRQRTGPLLTLPKDTTAWKQHLAELEQASASMQARAGGHLKKAILMVNLGPFLPASKLDNWVFSMWETGDWPWESPAGLGLLPLDLIASACSRVHNHLAEGGGSGSKEPSNVTLIHAHTCSGTGRPLAEFLGACHLIYSRNFDSAGAAMRAVKPLPPPNATGAGFAGFGVDGEGSSERQLPGVLSEKRKAQLLPGQRRYCEYLSWVLHHPRLLPQGADERAIQLTTITFCKLSAFGRTDGGQPAAQTPKIASPKRTGSGLFQLGGSVGGPAASSASSTPKGGPSTESSATDLSQLTTWVNPHRLVLSVYCRGTEVWCGGVVPGSVNPDEDVLAFDLHWSKGGRGPAPEEGCEAGAVVAGDVVVAVWFGDHHARGDPPRIAYAFHTAFVDGGSTRVRVYARHLDVPETSTSELLCPGLAFVCWPKRCNAFQD